MADENTRTVRRRDAEAQLMSTIDARLHAPALEVDEDKEPYFAEMRGYRATYMSVVAKARAAEDDYSPQMVVDAINEFDAIEAELLKATSEDVYKVLVARAEEVEQGRAYLQPKAEILVEAKTCFADMSDWSVPVPILTAINDDLFSIIKDDAVELERKRAALNKLYQYYDAWSDHVDRYEKWATTSAWLLGALLVVAALGCVYWIVHPHALEAFMVAGLTGALLSVLGKFPPMLGWGQWASYTPRMIGRITTGVVGTLAGGALLSLDIIKIDDKQFGHLLFGAADKPENLVRADMLLLVGLGVVFGFSERVLVQFQQVVFRGDADPGDKNDKT